jgi:hypothetical protein
MKRFGAQKAYLVCMVIMSLFISFLSGCGGGGGGVWNEPVASSVTVTSTVPLNAATSVAINSKITATFSGAMDPATIKSPATSFTLKEFVSGSPVAGVVNYTGLTADFKPAGNLKPTTKYTATITTGAKDPEGKALAADYTWTFTTGLTADSTAPTLLTTAAADGDTGLPINRNSTATFSEPMDPATLISPATSFTLKEFVSGTNVAGVVTYIGTTATFNPNSDLKPNTKYTSTITTGATDLAGNALVSGARANPWSWTTGATTDIIAPTVTNTNPVNIASNVPVNQQINATFSEEMRQTTIVTANFTVKETVSGIAVQGTVAYAVLGNIATFSPLANLKPDTDYTVTVTNGAKDLAGNALLVPAVGGLPKPNPWTFRTAVSVVPPATLAINLGRAASFGIASRAGLTSTGVTVVNGDIALSPNATCSDATGGPGSSSQSCLSKIYTSSTGMTVNGSIYWAGDPFDSGVTASAVTTDLTAAWNEGMSKVNTQPAIAAGEIGGKTFIPGVYENANLTLSAGGVATLDAQNDPNAIFIFKTTLGGDFVDSGTLLLPSRIVLLNGAQARNVWFVVGRDATIGSGTTWNGNILANRTVTVLNGSTVNGRVLGGAGGAGAITLTGAASPSVTRITVPQ